VVKGYLRGVVEFALLGAATMGIDCGCIRDRDYADYAKARILLRIRVKKQFPQKCRKRQTSATAGPLPQITHGYPPITDWFLLDASRHPTLLTTTTTLTIDHGFK